MGRKFLGTIKDFFNRLKKNRVLYTCIVMTLTFNLLIFSSFAWLTINRKMDADELGMALAVDDTNAVYLAYMYDLEAGKGTNTYIDENGVEQEFNITNIDLNQYDTIFRGQNIYTPVIAKIVLIRNQSMPLDGTIHITVTRDETKSNEEEAELVSKGALSSFTSSITRFTSFIIKEKSTDNPNYPIDYYWTDPDMLYTKINTEARFGEVENYSGQQDHSKTFVNREAGEGDSHTHSKSSSLTISVPYEASDWYFTEDENGALTVYTLNVYLYITYDPSLVDCYMEDHGSGGISLDDTTIFFDNDMEKVSVSYTANE